jgi:hypothetical protein
MANDPTYKLGTETYIKASGAPAEQTIISGVNPALPLPDFSPVITIPSTNNGVAVDTVTIGQNSYLYGISFAPIVGVDIAVFAKIQIGTNSITVPNRVTGIDNNTHANLGAIINVAFQHPHPLFLPSGSTITVYAWSTTGLSTDQIQIQYDIINAVGVN